MQPKLQNYLLEKGLIDPKILKNAVYSAMTNHQTLLYHFARNQLLTADVLVQITSELFNTPITDISNIDIQENLIKIIPLKLMNEFYIFPLRKNNTSIDLGMVDPSDIKAIEAAKFYSGLNINVLLIRYDQLHQNIKKIKENQTIQLLSTLKLNIKEEYQYHEKTVAQLP